MEKEKKESMFKKPIVQSITGLLVIILVIVSIFTYKLLSSRVSIDLGTIEAPVITISPESPGILDEVFVSAGDSVSLGQALAHIGGETLFAKVSGTILSVQNVPGQVFNASQAVITMIDPNELRVVGTIDENKGFSDIKVGNPVSFSVDAYPGKEFVGVVDEISPTSKQSGVTFSISDKREIKQFTIKVKYDTKQHPEFKNGMSAKLEVYIK